MSKLISLQADLFPKEGFNPGSGVLTVLVTDEYDFTGVKFEQAVNYSVPATTSYGRSSSYLSGSKERNIVYSYIGSEVRRLYDAWNARMPKKEQVPVITRQWVDEWFRKMGEDRNQWISMLGVAQPLDSISLGVTDRGGRRITICTFEEYGGKVFSQRMQSAEYNTATRSGLLEALTDVAVITAMANLNRLIMYYSIADACGWKRELSAKNRVTTINSGVYLEGWELLDGEVHVPDREPFLLPKDFDSWVVCQAPKGEANKAVPWKVQWDGDSSLKVRNNIRSKVSMTCLIPEYNWTTEYDEKRTINP